MTPAPVSRSFQQEFADFWQFLKRPTLRRAAFSRLARQRRHAAWLPTCWQHLSWGLADLSLGRIGAWVVFLWAINLLAFGPLASAVSTSTGSDSRLLDMQLSWFLVVVWAPVIEELTFRLWLRRPAWALWILPWVIGGIFYATTTASIVGVALGLALTLTVLSVRRVQWSWALRRRFVRVFPLVFYTSVLAFALTHLGNFTFSGTGLFMILLVLPQLSSGLVLGWMRVRYGIISAIALHALFNAGPMALLALAARYAPDLL